MEDSVWAGIAVGATAATFLNVGKGVQKMKVGGTYRLVCPAAIAYGDRGAGTKVKPGAALNFEVELIGIE